MNILLLNWRDIKNPLSGGAEIVTLEHAKAWVAAGHSVTWDTTTFSNAKKSETIDGVYIVRQGSIATIFLTAPVFYFRNKRNIDLVIDQIHGIPFFTPFYVTKPKLGYIHEIAGEIWDAMFPFPINILGKAIEKFMFLPYKSVPFMTVSESTKRELQKAGVRNVAVIHNGITIKKTAQSAKEKTPTFIFVSRLVKMKGIEHILKAFTYILQRDAKAKLWIVGDGNKKYVKSLYSMAEDYQIRDAITFHGHVSEDKKLELMGRAHILLHASVKEGWGLVVIEAASQHTPSVVYNSAGLRDSVIDGETGIVIKESTPELLAEQAYALYSDNKQYAQLQKNAYDWAKSLTWKDAAKKSLRLITKL